MRKPEPPASINSNKKKMKKGLWSPEEDEKLMQYMLTNGQGCWSDVARNAGLQRCGKSCRLRWINYLRPDLKRGAFDPHEQHLIIRLHSLLGNRWSQIAARLPGRTDNEIKNYWNSTIKKRLKNVSSTNASPNTSDSLSSPSSLEFKDIIGGFVSMQEQRAMASSQPSLQAMALNRISTTTPFPMLENGSNGLVNDGYDPYGDGFYGGCEVLGGGNIGVEGEFHVPPLESISGEENDRYKAEGTNDRDIMDMGSFVNRLHDNKKSEEADGFGNFWLETENLKMEEWDFEELMNEVPSLYYNYKPKI